MNKDRRRRLAKAAPLIAEALAKLAEARAIVSDVRDDEAGALDNLSEGARNGDAGDDMQSALDTLDTALDAFDGIDLRVAADAVETIAETSVPEEAAQPPRLSPKEIEERRWARLPAWAQESIRRLEKQAADADDRARSVFGERTDDPNEIVVGDYSSPFGGRVIPARQVTFPAFGITVSIERGRGGRGVVVSGERPLAILPNVSNSITIRTD